MAATGGRTHDERVATFLTYACWDHHTHGAGDHRMRRPCRGASVGTAPEIARDSLYTAIVCGELAEVQRLLTARPEAARRSGRIARLDAHPLSLLTPASRIPPTIANAVAIGRLLLDHGANPNDFYMAGDARYSRARRRRR